METTNSRADLALGRGAVAVNSGSAVSWAAVFAGAVISAALAVMLITGGIGLGFLSMSPWGDEGASGGALLTGTIIWLFLSQVIAYGIAGYITGRLRTKWQDVKADESFFRDTAHGFLVWSLSFLISLVFLGSTALSMVSGTVKAGASALGAGAGAVASVVDNVKESDISLDYFSDMLLRQTNLDDNMAQLNREEVRREVSAIFTRSIQQGEISQEDQDYLVSMISRYTGVDQQQAREKIRQVQENAQQTIQQAEIKAKEVADAARKSAAYFSLWVFASLLLGAFVCSFAAAIGGKSRDD